MRRLRRPRVRRLGSKLTSIVFRMQVEVSLQLSIARRHACSKKWELAPSRHRSGSELQYCHRRHRPVTHLCSISIDMRVLPINGHLEDEGGRFRCEMERVIVEATHRKSPCASVACRKVSRSLQEIGRARRSFYSHERPYRRRAWHECWRQEENACSRRRISSTP